MEQLSRSTDTVNSAGNSGTVSDTESTELSAPTENNNLVPTTLSIAGTAVSYHTPSQ